MSLQFITYGKLHFKVPCVEVIDGDSKMRLVLVMVLFCSNALLGTALLEALFDSPFLYVPSCTLESHFISVLDPTTLVRFGRVSRYFNELGNSGINTMYKIQGPDGLIWDIEKVYDIHQSVITDETISGPLEQLIRMNIPRKLRDVRLEGRIEYYFLWALFGKRLLLEIEYLSPEAIELSRMVLNHKRALKPRVFFECAVLNSLILPHAVPYMRKLRSGDDEYLCVSRPGIFNHFYHLIRPKSRSLLLTYLHENKTWKVDEIKWLLPVDLASAFYCCNMATDENHEAVHFIITNSMNHIGSHLFKWIKLDYNMKAIISMISCIALREPKKRSLICYLVQKNFPLETYKLVRGAQRVDHYINFWMHFRQIMI